MSCQKEKPIFKLLFPFTILAVIVFVYFLLDNISLVKVYADGETKEVRVFKPNQEKVLELCDITLNPKDKVEHNLESREKDLYIRIKRVVEKEVKNKVPVKYEIKIEQDKNMYKGEKKLVQKGEEGLLDEVYLITFEDGREIEKKLITREVVKEPVAEVFKVGTKEREKLPSRGGSREITPLETLEVIATAYTHTGNKTYTGIWPYRGVVAVDPKVIPLNSKLYVEGYGYGVAQDTGGKIKGKRIDLFMESTEKALKWGRRKVKVHILEKGKT